MCEKEPSVNPSMGLEEATNRLQKEIIELQEAVLFLGDKLNPLMTPVPEDKNVPVHDTDGLSPAVSKIVHQINEVRAIQYTVKNYFEKMRL